MTAESNLYFLVFFPFAAGRPGKFSQLPLSANLLAALCLGNRCSGNSQ
jgi:hypothetical protein